MDQGKRGKRQKKLKGRLEGKKRSAEGEHWTFHRVVSPEGMGHIKTKNKKGRKKEERSGDPDFGN